MRSSIEDECHITLTGDDNQSLPLQSHEKVTHVTGIPVFIKCIPIKEKHIDLLFFHIANDLLDPFPKFGLRHIDLIPDNSAIL